MVEKNLSTDALRVFRGDRLHSVRYYVTAPTWQGVSQEKYDKFPIRRSSRLARADVWRSAGPFERVDVGVELWFAQIGRVTFSPEPLVDGQMGLQITKHSVFELNGSPTQANVEAWDVSATSRVWRSAIGKRLEHVDRLITYDDGFVDRAVVFLEGWSVSVFLGAVSPDGHLSPSADEIAICLNSEWRMP